MGSLIFEKHVPWANNNFSLPKLDIEVEINIPEELMRTQELMLLEISEVEMVRHYKVSDLYKAMVLMMAKTYPLGSCTMKYRS